MRWEVFADRTEAGQALGSLVSTVHLKDPVVLAMPRGGVPVAIEVAHALGAPFDVIVVRKMGSPSQPELAMGTVGEDGVCVWNPEVLQWSGLQPDEVQAIRARESSMLAERLGTYRTRVPAQALDGKCAVIVDDGIATGSGAIAACQVARKRGAARIVMAVPVAPVGWESRFDGIADVCLAVRTPDSFRSVGSFYEDFHEIGDQEVLAALGKVAPGLARDLDGS
jgi:putative phosphoribosyl transferase